LQLYPDLVKPASSEISHEVYDDSRRWPFFKDAVGALDGTQLPIHVPAEQRARFRNRHGDLSQNVLAVVDFSMNFTYVLAGWEGSAHDGRVLQDAVSKGFAAPMGKYYLADAGYANKHLCLSPYRGVRYHLREIGMAGKLPKDKYELFNMRHSSLRSVVERTFGVYKRRWRIFDRPHEFDIRTQVKLVYALCALHNLVNEHRSMAEVEADAEAMGPYENELNDVVKREAENRENIAAETGMDARREDVADQMWGAYCIATGRQL
jgi:hypothetical protein